MLKVFKNWVQRYFSDEEAVVLAVVLALGFGIIISFGNKLAPLLTGLVLAYLLQGLVTQLRRWNVPHRLSVWIVFVLFVGALGTLFGVIAPLVWRQMFNLFNELYEEASQNLADQELRELAEESLPKLREHLAHAQELHSALEAQDENDNN
jgi:predicted PurR-regulated permease PerM